MEPGDWRIWPVTPSLPLPPRPTGQLTALPLPTLDCHSSTDGGEIGGEGVGGAGAVGAVNDENLGVREVDARVVLLEERDPARR